MISTLETWRFEYENSKSSETPGMHPSFWNIQQTKLYYASSLGSSRSFRVAKAPQTSKHFCCNTFVFNVYIWWSYIYIYMDHVFAIYILYYVTLLHLLILRVRDIAAPLLAGIMPFWSLQHAMCSTFDSKVFSLRRSKILYVCRPPH